MEIPDKEVDKYKTLIVTEALQTDDQKWFYIKSIDKKVKVRKLPFIRIP